MFETLRRWIGPGRAGAAQRWLVLDCESSGLDPERDRLLSIAAVALHVEGAALRLVPADSFEAVLQQPASPHAPDKTNILIHGIGVGAQQGGVAPAQALQDFSTFAAGAPLIGYHVSFDRRLIERTERGLGLRTPPRRWLDLAELAPVLKRDVPGKALDDWLQAFGIQCLVRHQAASDALATAELLQCLWPLARRQPEEAPDFRALQTLAEARRWLGA